MPVSAPVPPTNYGTKSTFTTISALNTDRKLLPTAAALSVSAPREKLHDPAKRRHSASAQSELYNVRRQSLKSKNLFFNSKQDFYLKFQSKESKSSRRGRIWGEYLLHSRPYSARTPVQPGPPPAANTSLDRLLRYAKKLTNTYPSLDRASYSPTLRPLALTSTNGHCMLYWAFPVATFSG